jgi:peptide deformylase
MNIVLYPHPALRHKARALTAITPEIRKYAAEMLEAMYAARGLGLAAPQVALPYQMFVMNPTADPQQREHERVLINPEILQRQGSIEGEEGCLSFPDLFQKVRRAKTVTMRYYDLQGQAVEITSSGDLESRVLQHEHDHLHGILFIDKMGYIAKLAARGTLRAFEEQFRKAQERGDIPPNVTLEQHLRELEEKA